MQDYLVFLHTTGPTISPDIPSVVHIMALNAEDACNLVFYSRGWNPKIDKVYLTAHRATMCQNESYQPIED